MIKILNLFGLYTYGQLRDARDAYAEMGAIQCDMLAQLYPNDKVAFDVGYTMGAKRCAKELRKMKSGNLKGKT